MLSLALAFCSEVDAFGMGLWSRGPSHDKCGATLPPPAHLLHARACFWAFCDLPRLALKRSVCVPCAFRAFHGLPRAQNLSALVRS